MGIRQTNFKKAQMKLFAVLALVVVARQVDKYDNDVEIGGPCTLDGDDCGLLAECNTEKKCACREGFDQDGETNNCKAKTIELGKECDAAPTTCGTNAACQAPTWLKAIRAAGDVCTIKLGCADKLAECDETELTCQCKAGHTADDKVCKVDEATEGSAAFYSVATAFMTLILV